MKSLNQLEKTKSDQLVVSVSFLKDLKDLQDLLFLEENKKFQWCLVFILKKKHTKFSV